MQEAAVVLGVLRERGRKGLPFTQLYRQMFSRDLYLLAYGNIYSNQGAMTPGAGGETADGMSEDKIDQIIGLMRHERYRFAPARRIFIPKKNGKLRPLGLPSWPDKLVGEVVRLLLEAIYEPCFSGMSHGFRKGRGCHTALRKIQETWTGTTWFIEGDISDCFGSFSHEILLEILAEKIRDNRFLRLIRNMLKAGYLEDWEYHDTLSGVPQGGVVSPILSSIYLDKLDKFVEQELIPQYTRGARRKRNPEYHRIAVRLARARRRGDRAAARDLARRVRALPSGPGGPRLPAAAIHKVRRRPHTGIHRAEGRSRADQGQAGGVPPGDPRAGTERGQDPDHPRPHQPGAVPRLSTSSSSTATPSAPAAAARPTGRSRCGSRRTWSRPSAPATGSTANRGTGPGSRTWTTTTSSAIYGAEYRGVVKLLPLRHEAQCYIARSAGRDWRICLWV